MVNLWYSRYVKQLLGTCFIFSAVISSLYADSKGYNIQVKINNYTHQELTLAYYYGDKQYILDTAYASSKGVFIFQADTLFPCGVYLLVTKPDNKFIEFLAPADDQQFTLTTDFNNLIKKMQVDGSEENELFYNYLRFIEIQNLKNDSLKNAGKPKGAAEFTAIDKLLNNYKADLAAKHSGTLCAKLVKSSIDLVIPDFTGTQKEIELASFYWYRKHFFDNIDISDPCLLRAPQLYSKVNQYMTNLVVQHPDSINIGLDYIFSKAAPSKEIFRFMLIHYLNLYAKSNYVGQDACYVHIAKNYYCNGKAPWINKDELQKICDNAARLEPLLIGKKGPDLLVTNREQKTQRMWETDAAYTVLYFWEPDCGSCKKTAADLVDFAKKFRTRGVKVFAVCTAPGTEEPACWSSATDLGFADNLIMNMSDRDNKSNYKSLYGVNATPKIFILNRQHEIVSKQIGVNQLAQVMETILE